MLIIVFGYLFFIFPGFIQFIFFVKTKPWGGEICIWVIEIKAGQKAQGTYYRTCTWADIVSFCFKVSRWMGKKVLEAIVCFCQISWSSIQLFLFFISIGDSLSETDAVSDEKFIYYIIYKLENITAQTENKMSKNKYRARCLVQRLRPPLGHPHPTYKALPWVFAAVLWLQLPATVPWNPQQRPGLSSSLPDLAWPTAGHGRHLGREPENKSTSLFSHALLTFLKLRIKKKRKEILNQILWSNNSVSKNSL